MRKIPGGRVGIHRKYYDPAKNPKPRPIIGGQELEAVVVKETRQLRRQRERKEGK